jgi:DNA-directed RNA polymerase subunit alpha
MDVKLPEQGLFIEKLTDNHGVFIFEPLESGYGVTVGNALRRVLISSLDGYAIIGIRIPGVKHEFDTIDGVVESLVDIILNLKRVIFKKTIDTPENKILVKIKNQSVFKASDIDKASSSFEIINPDHIICHLDESVYLEIEIYVGKGKGYVPAEENDLASTYFDTIKIDSIFTPITNVSYKVEDIRVGQKTDYDKLILDINTNGSIKPDYALKTAASIITNYFNIFLDNNIKWKTKNEEEVLFEGDILTMKKVLSIPLADLNMSVRSFNCLNSANIKTLGDLVKLDIADMMQFKNFGKKSLTELTKILEERDLKFGLDLSKYGL